MKGMDDIWVINELIKREKRRLDKYFSWWAKTE